MYLVQYDYNWADEITFRGTFVLEDIAIFDVVRQHADIIFPCTVYVGSNQGIEVTSFATWVRHFDITPVPAEHEPTILWLRDLGAFDKYGPAYFERVTDRLPYRDFDYA